ncbi:hypothetical protein [Gordonia sp. NB41Y]|uniref:hypothetical protein n=1 Tax=Gordonia sp. NB41Y TaxID=875808 RepID=UPI0006B23117|nr:hypothetical protein [Gordonia sp. NB41Y]EMP10018.2 hypothetical protein ISGA_1581 [Gordonia sp. NB41Y]WLP90241.1 hypothetical protein Q9K23_22450 [Gordonia sp. NB41Y]
MFTERATRAIIAAVEAMRDTPIIDRYHYDDAARVCTPPTPTGPTDTILARQAEQAREREDARTWWAASDARIRARLGLEELP